MSGEVTCAVRGLSKSFGGNTALSTVDLDLYAGEIHGLIGHNGSGKSTLIKVLAGYHRPDGGEVRCRDVVLELGGPAAAADAGIRFVHQDLGLVAMLSVSENFHAGTMRGFRPWLTESAQHEVTRAATQALGWDIDPRAEASSLTDAEQAVVAIARAVHGWEDGAVSVLVLDEVTVAFPFVETVRIFETFARLRDRGIALLFVSHHLDEVLRICDRVTVLRDGVRVDTRPRAELDEPTLVELMLGRQLEPAAVPVGDQQRAGADRAELLAVRELSGRTLRSLSFSVRAGEVVGFAGITGSGREELPGLVFGQVPRRGEVRVGGRAVGSLRPWQARAAGVGYVPSERLTRAVFPEASVAENLTVARLRPLATRLGWLRESRERAEAQEWTDTLQIRTAGVAAPILSLSGGNQQKVVIARWLRTPCRVLVLDEPTQGVDVGAKRDIHEQIRGAVEGRGLGVVLSSIDTEELVSLCDVVHVLSRGSVVRTLTGSDVNAATIDRLQLESSEGETR